MSAIIMPAQTNSYSRREIEGTIFLGKSSATAFRNIRGSGEPKWKKVERAKSLYESE